MADPASFWNERYQREDYLFGTEANDFIRAVTPVAAPGMRAFAPADGEGRNGVHLARLGYEVSSIDASNLAVDKAFALAESAGVTLNARAGDMLEEDWPENHYDLVVVCFMHFMLDDHDVFMGKVRQCLKPGGLLIMENYTVDQIPLTSGGPKKPEMLLTPDRVRADLAAYDIAFMQEIRRHLTEGPRHQGIAATIQVIARKKDQTSVETDGKTGP